VARTNLRQFRRGGGGWGLGWGGVGGGGWGGVWGGAANRQAYTGEGGISGFWYRTGSPNKLGADKEPGERIWSR